MKPVAIFRFAAQEGAGYFSQFLERQGIPWQLIAIDAGDFVPTDVRDFSGICLMGGPMSVNDPLPWISPMCALIQAAQAQHIPVIGHCLGGQLMSKALGGQVKANPVKEIGWSTVQALPSAAVTGWLGAFVNAPLTVFQWHGETFSVPAGATLIASNAYCQNQIMALGPHLALQCHVEMTPEMIAAWCGHWAAEVGRLPVQPSIQTPAAIYEVLDVQLPRLHALADQLYGVWIQGLV